MEDGPTDNFTDEDEDDTEDEEEDEEEEEQDVSKKTKSVKLTLWCPSEYSTR